MDMDYINRKLSLIEQSMGIEDALNVDDNWTPTEGFLDVKPEVVLHDRLMSDAILGSGGAASLKSEHDYCSRLLNTDDESSVDSSIIALQRLGEDLGEECFPVIPVKMEPESDDDEQPRRKKQFSGLISSMIMVKDEPMSDEESSRSSYPGSPRSASVGTTYRIRTTADKRVLKTIGKKTDSVRNRNVVARNGLTNQSARVLMPRLNNSGPPTPPSSTSSDSENGGNLSPERSLNGRLYLSLPHNGSTRHPINTPLISSQPKGSTGILHLTEEEKRTLVAEGYPVPTKLPLSKAEEKSLKKIRRKIKNKISAQESRRKKKEYMDALERKVEMLSTQNSEFRKQIVSLEGSNSSLVIQIQKLRQLIDVPLQQQQQRK